MTGFGSRAALGVWRDFDGKVGGHHGDYRVDVPVANATKQPAVARPG
jgi:hypothetical protein